MGATRARHGPRCARLGTPSRALAGSDGSRVRAVLALSGASRGVGLHGERGAAGREAGAPGETSVVILKLPQVQAKTGLGKTRVYGLVRSGDFPKPVRLGKKAVGWVDAEIEEWILRRMALRDDLGEALVPQGQG